MSPVLKNDIASEASSEGAMSFSSSGMKSIKEAGDLKGKRVLVRVDWSVPTAGGKVVDDYQIIKSLPTIEYLQKAGAKVTLMSHGETSEETLKPIAEHVQKYLPALTFVEPSDLVLLENLRNDPREKENDKSFAKQLAKNQDIYVNEAFPVCHRRHASVVGVPELLPSFAGFQLEKEIEELTKAFYPKHPFLFILGGAKFDTKLPLLKKFVGIADQVFVGGALANNFLKEEGKDIGISLVQEGNFGLKELLDTGKIILPEDTIVDMGRILDVGPKSLEALRPKIAAAKMILWNGPLGYYEIGYKVATLELAKLLAEFGHNAVIGGGDTLAAVKELNLFDKFAFVSTGGGAMLDFLSTGTLPGVEALK